MPLQQYIVQFSVFKEESFWFMWFASMSIMSDAPTPPQLMVCLQPILSPPPPKKKKKKKLGDIMQLFSADPTMFFLIFFCPWIWKKTPSKVVHNWHKFFLCKYCQPAQNQPKFQLFKNIEFNLHGKKLLFNT